MKKILVLAVMILCASVVFAQGTNFASLDLFPLFQGINDTDGDDGSLFIVLTPSYERLFGDNFSIGAELDLAFGNLGKDDDGTNEESLPFFGLGVIAKMRYYPFSSDGEKLFFGAGVGISIFSLTTKKTVIATRKTTDENNFSFNLNAKAEIGYKIVTNFGIFFEPSLSCSISSVPGLIGAARSFAAGGGGGGGGGMPDLSSLFGNSLIGVGINLRVGYAF